MRSNLQQIRKEAGFKSAAAFATRMGISVGTYTNYEQGKNKLTLEMAWQFADALGEAMGRYVSLDELAGREFPLPSFGDRDQDRLNEVYAQSDREARRDILRAAENALAASQGREEGTSEEDAPQAGLSA